MNYKIEMHLHSKGTSHCAKVDADLIIPTYKAAGYNAIVCTNHWNNTALHYLHGFTSKTKIKTFIDCFDRLEKLGNENGIKVYFGLELALKGDDYKAGRTKCAEILIYGITREQFLFYNKNLINQTYENLRELATKNNWLLIQSHPFRPNSKQLPKTIVDGVESFNSHKGHDNHNDLATKWANDNSFIKTSGSDYHKIGMEHAGIIADHVPANESQLVQLLKSEKYELII